MEGRKEVIKEARKFGNTEERGKILGLKGQFLTRGVGSPQYFTEVY